MSTQSPGFFQEELDGRQIAALVADTSLTPNMVIESLWHGRLVVRRNAANALPAIAPIPEVAEAFVAIAARDSDSLVRDSIVRAVAQNVCSGAVAVPILLDGLLNSDEEIRIIAYSGLATRLQRDRADIAPRIIKALKDPRAAVVAACAKLLTEDGDEGSVPLLIPLLGCGDNRIVRPAYDVLDRLKYKAVTPLVGAIADPLTRRFAVKLLSGLPSVNDDERRALDASWALADSLGDASWRAAVVTILDELTRLVVPVRTQPLNLPIPDFGVVRLSESALEAASRQHQTPEDLEEALYALRDGRDHVRHNALVLLGFMRWSPDRSASVAARVLPLVKDADVSVRLAAMTTVGRFDAASVAVGALAALGETNADVRQAAVAALREAGPAALAAALQRLPLNAGTRTEDGLLEVAVALGGASVTVLADAIAQGAGLSATARVVAVRGLGLLGGTAEDGLSVLIAALADSLEDVRREAATAIGNIGVNDPAIIGALKGQMQDTVATVRRQAALAVARITGRPLDDRGASEPRPLPIAAFETELATPKHLSVVSEIGEDGHPVVDPALLIQALRDGRVMVRRNAARAIGLLAGRGASFAVQLALALRDGDLEVRRDAAEALSTLGEHAEAGLTFAVASLGARDEALHGTLVSFIAKLFPASEPFIIEGLRVDPDEADAGIFDVIRTLEGAIVSGLATAGLSHPSGLIRLNAARALGVLSDKGAASAIDALTEALSDRLGQVRAAAEAALDSILRLKPRPIRVLEAVPLPFDGFDSALATSEEIAAHSESFASLDETTLLRLLADGRAIVRANALSVAATMPATPALTSNVTCLLRDAETAVRLNAVAFLARPPATIAVGRALAPLVLDREPTVATAVAAVLDANAELFFPAVVALGGSVSEFDLRRAVFPRVRAGGAPSIAFLAQLLAPESETPDALTVTALRLLRAFTHPALVELQDGEVAASLTARAEVLLRSSDAALRHAATAAHARLTGADSQPAALDPVPLPAEGFDTALLSRAQLEGIAGDLRFDLLIHALSDGRETVRANATAALGQLGAAEASSIAPLCRMLRDSSGNVRALAAESLGLLSPSREASFGLVGALFDGAPPVVNAARQALAAAGLFALEALVYALDDEPRLAGRTVLPVLAELGEPALDALTVAAGNASPLVRRNALIALRLFEREAAASARGAVTKLEHDDDRNVRLEARATRDWLEGVDRRIVAREPQPLPHPEFVMRGLDLTEVGALSSDVSNEQLFGFVRDGRRRARENAIRALGVRGVYHPWLGFALKDDSLDVQRAAARALKTLGPKALAAAPQLIEALEEDDAPIVFDAKDALIALGADVVPAIVMAARTTPDRFRSNLLPIVDKLGEVAAPAMIAALDHASAFVIMNALMSVEVLAERGGQGAMAKVIELTGHPLPALVRTAKKTLVRLEGRTPAEFRKEAVPMPIAGFDIGSLSTDVITANLAAVDRTWLRSAIFDGRDRVRENAAACIGHLGAEGADFISLLVIALKDSETDVQIAAAEACGTLALGDAEAIPALIASLRLAREASRRAALTALDRFGPDRVATVAMQHLVGLEDRMLQSMGRVAHRMAEAFVPALSKLAADAEASLTARENAVVILGDLVARARPAEETLIGLVTHQDGMLAFKAATALARVGTPGPAVADRLAAAALKEKRPSVVQALRNTAKILRRRRAD